jgi:hypothetical protein
MTSFWDAFWPAFWASLPASFLGVLGALVVGWVLLRLTEHHQRADQRQQLVKAIRVLRTALVDNSNVFQALADSFDKGDTPTDTYLNSATWVAIGPRISSDLQDYQLLGDIAAYYASVGFVGRVHDRLLDLTMGPAATLPNASYQRADLFKFLRRRLGELKGDAHRIVAQLDTNEARLTNTKQ